MTDQTVFCNTPWYELHIYWDGSLGICCQESHKLYNDDSYNITTMSLQQWFNSEPVRNFRQQILQNKKVSACTRCYHDENFFGSSRRLRSNHKSAIFTQSAFHQSFLQSPGYRHFEYAANNQGHTTTLPIDLHIDLGNYCNLACKMCKPQASTTIASQQVKWGIESSRQYLGVDWTRDKNRWQVFLQELADMPGLKNIHFMGGETLLSPRLEQLVDWFSQLKRYDLCFSFVTNGTVYNDRLVQKIKSFTRVGIEVSIETVDEHNAYQRQGTDTEQVLSNIDRYLDNCNGTTMTVTLRPAPSALTVGYYHSLLEYALRKNLVVKSNLCFDPAFMHISVLPTPVKQFYLEPYRELIDRLPKCKVDNEYNASDPNNVELVIGQQAEMIANMLQSTTPSNQSLLLQQLVDHCRRWDQVYGLDARKLYPELQSVWDQYAY